MKEVRKRGLALIRLSLSRTTARKAPRRPRGPDAAGEGMTVDPPRTPTLSGGAAAAIDA